MPRIRLTVAYDGTDFHGWQKQKTPEGDVLRTAQGVLEDAVRQVVREQDVNVVGASRTDAGVHARGQVAAFTTSREIPFRKLTRAINSRLPGDIQVRRARPVQADWSPITACRAKAYQYRIAHGCGQAGARRPLFDRRYVSWTGYTLDPTAMNEAARHLIGEHDFTSCTRVHHGRESTVRTVYDCQVRVTSRHRCLIEVSGNGFLYNMVRIIAGTLLEVGRGKLAPAEIPGIIGACNRDAAGPTLPPQGLCLMWIRY